MQFDTVTIAKRLRQCREEQGLSHDRLSEQLKLKCSAEISRDSLINYEIQEKNHPRFMKNAGMSIKNLFALADFYGVSTDWLLGLSDIRSPSIDVQGVCEYTGFSENTVINLHNLNCDVPSILSTLNEIITNRKFVFWIADLTNAFSIIERGAKSYRPESGEEVLRNLASISAENRIKEENHEWSYTLDLDETAYYAVQRATDAMREIIQQMAESRVQR